MRRFTVIIAVVAVTGLVASSGCTLELGELDDLFTITVGGDEDDACLEAFDECVADPDISLADCAARLSACESEPTDPPEPGDRCYEDFEMCLREADGSDPGDDRVVYCEERLRACLGEPGPEPDPTRSCYEEYDFCMAEWDDSGADDDWARMCEERLDECLRGIVPEPGPEPTPDGVCFPLLERCIADDGSIIEDSCAAEFVDCVAVTYPAGDGCARELEACVAYGGDEGFCVAAIDAVCR